MLFRILRVILDFVDPKLDYRGQQLNNRIMIGLFVVGYTASTAIGWLLRDFSYILYGCVLTALLNALLTVPAWKMYRRHPLKFKKHKNE
ncbi:SPCS1 [Enterospora canceri]|uniref:Signal peptidase complex subunit 1 n=1 Tax=Enterospora canceri TaxID=1081671 RepID=A0A1Y1S816_9MICR|nr:SPCS1 [Enterospora canceri]